MLEKSRLRYSREVLNFLNRVHSTDNTTRTIAFKDQRLNFTQGKLAKMTSAKTKTASKANTASKKTSKTVPATPVALTPTASLRASVALSDPIAFVTDQTPELDTIPQTTSPYKISLEKGTTDWSVSDQWARRSPDERFTSYKALSDHIRTKHGEAQEIELDAQHLKTCDASTSRLLLMHQGQLMAPTNSAFTQLCNTLKIPPTFLSECEPDTAGQLLQEFMRKRNLEGKLKALAYPTADPEVTRLEAITPLTYQRIWNRDILRAIDYILQIMPSFKVPGELDWGTMKHNPNVDVTKDNTTLFAGEHDMFIFMCDDANPIEAGKTAQGDTDVYFPGFKFSNSETGWAMLEGSSFFLRGVCFNRSLRGVEGIKSFRMKHTKNAVKTFENKSASMTRSLHQADPKPFVDLITRARTLQIAKNTEECVTFLQKRGFSKRVSSDIVQATVEEEQEEPRTAFLMAQGITAYARKQDFQDRRYDLELTATQVLELAS